MNIKTNKNIKLGLFILIGVLIFVVTIYYVGSQQSLFKSTVKIDTYFKNVGGLQVGNNVRYAGINIGTVKSISIISDSKVRVSMVVSSSASQFIKQDAEVSIGSEGLMGNKVVSISSGSASENIGEEAVLNSVEPMEIDQILVELEKTAKHAQEIMINLEAITNHVKNGEGTIGRLLTDEKLVNNFDKMIEAYSNTGQNVELFSQNIVNISHQLQKGEGPLGKMLSDSTMARQLQNSMEALESTIANTSEATQGLADFSEKLNNNSGTLGKLLTDTVMAERVEQSIMNIQRGSDKLEVTMEKINDSWLLNLFGGKEKKEKGKEESLR